MSDTFALTDLLNNLEQAGHPYYEFLRRDSLSVGIYHLAPGEPDRQRPHTEDEIYYVLGGEGQVEIDGRRTAVRPGSIVFVEQAIEHRFVDYPEGLTLLVVFAPARGSQAP